MSKIKVASFFWDTVVVYNICDSAVLSAVHDQLASLDRDAQLTCCFSAVVQLCLTQAYTLLSSPSHIV